jgi:hypothetical protein
MVSLSLAAFDSDSENLKTIKLHTTVNIISKCNHVDIDMINCRCQLTAIAAIISLFLNAVDEETFIAEIWIPCK